MGQQFSWEEAEAAGEMDVAELQEWYKKFVVECPSGTLFMHEFKRFFKVTGNEEATQYVEGMFRAFDKNGVRSPPCRALVTSAPFPSVSPRSGTLCALRPFCPAIPSTPPSPIMCPSPFSSSALCILSLRAEGHWHKAWAFPGHFESGAAAKGQFVNPRRGLLLLTQGTAMSQGHLS